jgi:hypothetical protein
MSPLTPLEMLTLRFLWGGGSGVHMLEKLRSIDWINWESFYQQIESAHLERRLAELSKVQVFSDAFSMALTSWVIYALDHDAYLEGLLSNARRNASALHRSLQELHHRLERTAWQVENGKQNLDLDVPTFERMPPSEVADLIVKLSRLVAVAEGLRAHNALSGPLRGRHRGIKAYPGLRELIFLLEAAAQIDGGTFTVHRKLGSKGTVVQAVDSLRDCFLKGHPDLKQLATFLPAPGTHPVALYERALKAARKGAVRVRRWGAIKRPKDPPPAVR